MARYRRVVLWAALVFIAALFILSVYGSFLGAEKARAVVNTPPVGIYWVLFIVLLAVGILLFKRLLRSPGLLAMHLGCILVFCGGLWASKAGHRLQATVLGRHKIPSGRVRIYEGLSENRVVDQQALVAYVPEPNNNVLLYEFTPEGEWVHDDQGRPIVVGPDDPRVFTLPFDIHLEDFRLEYYDPPQLYVETEAGQDWQIDPVERGAQYNLGEAGVLTILDVYDNFKVANHNGQMVPYDDPGPGSNPAVWVQIDMPDGTQERHFVFAQFPGHQRDDQKFTLHYTAGGGMIKDYFSDLQIIQDGRVVLEKTIEVNDPLHYGGYHFYQSGYDPHGRYTVLSVTSDSGLPLVWTGYILLVAGIIWHQWATPAWKYLRGMKPVGSPFSSDASNTGPEREAISGNSGSELEAGSAQFKEAAHGD